MRNILKTKRIKRINKFIIVLCVFIMSCFGVGHVDASTTLVYDSVGDYYAFVTLDKPRLFNFRIYQFNGKPAYCVELGKLIPNYVYDRTSDYESLGFTDSQNSYVSLVSYYGYEYPGHTNDYKYYMAAQELIWEYLSGKSVYWTDQLSKDNPRKIDIDKYLDEINYLVSMHNVLPSFGGYENYYEYSIGEDIVIEDTNGVLSNYSISLDENVGAYIKGNKLVIPKDNLTIGKHRVVLKQNVYNYGDGGYYYNGESQTLYSAGTVNSNIIYFDYEVNGFSLTLNKYDSVSLTNIAYGDYSLSGAKYGLYDSDDNLVTILTTDENGQASVDNLVNGIYTLKELEASYGYVLDGTVYSVEIKDNDSEITVYEDADLKKLEIYKTYDDDNIAEMEVVFDIITEDGEVYDSIVTDSNGYGSILLPYGKYEVIQRNSIDGYYMVDSFNVDINSLSDDTITYYLNDKKIIVSDNPSTNDDIYKNFISLFGCVALIGVCSFILHKSVL
jgi:hypothetical protein